MNETELSVILDKMIKNAKKGNVSVQYHLFGIKYATEISEFKINIVNILEKVGVQKSLATEIRKGIKLSQYIKIKD